MDKKTIYDFTGVSPGEIPDLDKLAQAYGDTLKGLPEEVKTWLLVEAATEVDNRQPDFDSFDYQVIDEVATYGLPNFPYPVQLGLTKFLAATLPSEEEVARPGEEGE
ncbi:MAG TPA: hypothetical protein VK203_27530 [Nostocaceae cyanobacterium]|nr:hypothetical protein [Nostocaceae cyanobacterium]